MDDKVFYLGPMFGGKTTEMLRALMRHRVAGHDCVLVKSSIDDRYSGAAPVVTTHDGASTGNAKRIGRTGALRVVVASKLAEVNLEKNELVVGIDEGQFFEDLREGLLRWTARKVFVAALDGDFRRIAFPAISAALPLATSFQKLHAVCMLCEEGVVSRASYTRLLAGGSRTEIINVGGRETYAAVCGACYEREDEREDAR